MARVRCRRCADGVEHDYPHGANAYREHGCRCDVCTAAHTQEAWEYNRRSGLARQRARYSPDKRRDAYHADLDRICERNREYARLNQERMSARQKEWYARNPGANAAAYRRRMQKRRNINAVNSWNPWTPQDDALAMSNLSVLEIAHTLGRTYAAVEGRRRTLRLQEQAA